MKFVKHFGRRHLKKINGFECMIALTCIIVLGPLLTYMKISELNEKRNELKLEIVKRHAADFKQDKLVALKATPLYQNQTTISTSKKNTLASKELKRPVVWIEEHQNQSKHLGHVVTVFERIGYEISYSSERDWDVLWDWGSPFGTFNKEMLNLKPHQRVNHVPSSGAVTHKLNLAKTRTIPYIPKAFNLPRDKDEFLIYMEKNPDEKWMRKNNYHQGIRLVNKTEVNVNTKGTFIQRYIDDPYLIDGRRFDIGVYVAIVSSDPLRIYIYSTDWHMRFCTEPYHPFDAQNLKKYVVTLAYLPINKVKSLKDSFARLGYSYKQSLLHHLKKNGYDTDRLEYQIEDAIKQSFYTKQHLLRQGAAGYKTSSNFFELVRFDFILDSKLNVYLMEANMSPNLVSSYYPPNKTLFQQVIYSLLHLLGLANTEQRILSNQNRSTIAQEERNMIVTTRNILIDDIQCLSEICVKNCTNTLCKLCPNCLTKMQITTFKMAYQEHQNKLGWRRVIPRKFNSQDEASEYLRSHKEQKQNVGDSNRWLDLWFTYRCIQDISWCV